MLCTEEANSTKAHNYKKLAYLQKGLSFPPILAVKEKKIINAHY